jgi:hypothetical protein
MKLSQNHIETVKAEMKGSRLDKFLSSVQNINDSLEAGGWLPKASRSADSGFYQGSGIDARELEREHRDLFPLYMTLRFGGSFHKRKEGKSLEDLLPLLDKKTLKKHSMEFVKAWVALCGEKDRAIAYLNSLRPLPVKTEIGLSPKVTTTLKEMNLDIDLPSIKMAKINYFFVPKRNLKTGEQLYGQNGECLLDHEYYVEWSEGIVHNQSRFNRFGYCQACGKNIPSGRFVPIEAKDKKSNNLVSFWVGCDCAKNIFGIKDEGIRQGVESV